MRTSFPCGGARTRRFLSSILVFTTALMISGCASDPAPKMLAEGWQQLGANQPDRALVTAQNIITEAPRSPRAAEALYLKGRAPEAKTAASPLDQRRNLVAAYEAYSEALKKRPNKALSGRIHAGMGNAAYWLDDYSSAWRNWGLAYDLTEDFTAKGYVLYRIGLCQQRLGRFEQADKTFAAVAANFPRTDAAARAKEKVGVRNFSVQVATFASPQNADTAIHALRGQGFAPQRTANLKGQTVVTVAPFGSYQQARTARDRLASMFPDALVVP
jgi:tetratricopeptide (TPR) repeat protein